MVGFTMLQIPDIIELDSEPFYKPYLAVVPYIKTSYQSVNAVCLADDFLYPDNDLALPLSILWTAAAGEGCSQVDIDKSGRVNFADFASFAAAWLESGCAPGNWCSRADFTGDENVTVSDLLVFSECWLRWK